MVGSVRSGYHSDEGFFVFSLSQATAFSNLNSLMHQSTFGMFLWMKCFQGYGLIAKSGLLEQAQKHFPVGNALSKTPFSNLLTVTCEDDKKNEIPVEISSNLDILSGPAYSLAPVPYLAQRFIRSCFMPCRRL